MVVRRFEIYFINLDPTKGSEINKTRPCVILSADEINEVLQTVIVAPLTSTIRKGYPTRVNCTVAGQKGQIVLDQIHTIDKTRLTKKVEMLDANSCVEVLEILAEMFS